MHMIRVAIFEDNHALRDSLSMLIESSPECELTGAYPDARRIESRISQATPDVVLMDINMPGISGIEAVAALKKDFPAVKVLMQTVFDEEDKIFASICAGASGYVLKNTPPEKLLEAIREVNDGGAFFTPSIARKVLDMAAVKDLPAENFTLSVREKEILQKLVDGLSYKMIAAELDIAFYTVHSHIKNIYEKLHVNSKSEAVAKALKNRLV
ncbi:MAG: DNA-binding response regulator [Chitinophagaceae bacterium]|jgi:DNA-binding NarL/FixJ family response regulator|nr:DNA-binding response regulator [Chitinophagaceae bacterium]